MLYDRIRSECYDNFNNSVYYGLLADRMLSIIKTYDINPQKILDICCGTGQLTGRLKQKYQKSNIIGLDISQGMLDIASKKYPDILFINQDANTIILNQRFDLVTSNFGVQWLNVEFTNNFIDLCNPNAKIIVSLPNYGEGSINAMEYTFVGNRVFQMILRLSKVDEFNEKDIVKKIISVWKSQLKANEIIDAFNKNNIVLIDVIDAYDYIEYNSPEELLYSLITRGMFGTVLDDISFNARALLLEEIEKEAKKHGHTSSSHNGVKGWWLYNGTKLVIP